MLGGLLETNSILWLIISGGIAGAIAKFIMPGKDPGGLVITVLLGIAGGVLMGFVGRLLGFNGNGAGIILAIIGAVILLAIYRMIKSKTGGGDTSA